MKRKVTMDPRSTQSFLSALWEQYRHRGAIGPRIDRRAFLRSGTGVAAVSMVGMGGLLELLSNREALAIGNVIPIVGITRAPFEDPDETPHRHTFSLRFRVTDISPTAITGTIVGRTDAVISTGDEREEHHVHIIERQVTTLEQVVLSGPENGEEGEHTHEVSIE